ncbi:Ubiquitin carboxyl-terminal hydrolase 7 [Puccinia graminis f. sp. tritici]|uniref:Ubiquitin carboxyl-terminal hydrolase 7 n=1 Tax=Puccinia graminis f. sp. tritici TaxID=56615 RepID=A0A5B0RXK1_PUCGR|nr:Ubiquitin carboxyl-terminal hydrolase 7 [Puccinia graminis f. sp. tritici]KAA1129244.1 Ubiquitin carboxyl-terminal hydrolase 7 [Puccinia graminis f. sp. tritici]
MTRTKRKHELRARKLNNPLPLGAPDRFNMDNTVNHQGHKGACAVMLPATRASPVSLPTQSESPLSPGSPDLLARRKANNHQGYKETRVVSTLVDKGTVPSKSPLSPGSPELLARRKANNHQGYKETRVVSSLVDKQTVPSKSPSSPDQPNNHQVHKDTRALSSSVNEQTVPLKSPLSPGSPELLARRKANNHQGYKETRVVSSCTARAMSIPVPKPRNPPAQYPSGTAKKIARAHRKNGTSEDTYFIICSPSQTPVSPKYVIKLPILAQPSRQIVSSSSLTPQFIFETHSFNINPPTSTFNKLCDIIQTLHAMAKFRPCNKRNHNRINGEMHMIGFQPGNDRGKSAGTYARRTDLTPAEKALDDTLWAKLQSHNEFLSQRMEAISRSAYEQNKNLMNEYGLPNWSQEEWSEMRKEDRPEYKFASNVSVTYNDFYNEQHQDKNDINGWSYGLFSYIELGTGKPIPPPSTELGHGFLFPRHAYLIDFVKAAGIVELVWQTSMFEHCTTQPPESLRMKKGRNWTHQGCSFQINKNLAKVAQELKDSSPQYIEKKTLCKQQKYGS